MKEIKIRAWDLTNNKFLYNNKNQIVTNIGIWLSKENKFAEGKYVFMISSLLKDKNSVEIYEGDIVVVDGKPSTVTVYMFAEMYNHIGDIEVVGNIFENNIQHLIKRYEDK